MNVVSIHKYNVEIKKNNGKIENRNIVKSEIEIPKIMLRIYRHPAATCCL